MSHGQKKNGGSTVKSRLATNGPEDRKDPLSPIPQWNPHRRELRWNGLLVKRFRQRPGIQEMILQAFEEEGWPDAIDDPLPGRPDKDPSERLHNAVQRLNRNQKEASLLFERDGTGCRVLWRYGIPRKSQRSGKANPQRTRSESCETEAAGG